MNLVDPIDVSCTVGDNITFVCLLRKASWSFIPTTKKVEYAIKSSDTHLITYQDNSTFMRIKDVQKKYGGQYKCLSKSIDKEIWWSRAYLKVSAKGEFVFATQDGIIITKT